MGCSPHAGFTPLTRKNQLRESLRYHREESAHHRCLASAAHARADIWELVVALETAVQFDELAQGAATELKEGK